MTKLRSVLLSCLFYSGVVLPAYVLADDLPAIEMSLNDLLDIQVTSVSKHSESLSDAAAAVYVVTADDIKRRGSTTILDAIRLVPGLHVAQIDSQKWAVSSRGFNGRFNNKMLVLIDGRSLYSPEFSGVYWETTDTLIEDIERIEVIRGPNAALWGVNAVNGVINITTKHTTDTLGGYVELGAGTKETVFSGFRYGKELTSNTTARVYAKAFKRDGFDIADDVSPMLKTQIANKGDDNDWWSQQVGGRIDILLSPERSLRLSADAYDTHLNQSLASTNSSFQTEYFNDAATATGWNISAEYTQALSAKTQYTVKTYFDSARRDEILIGFQRDTFDAEYKQQYALNERHDLIWGLQYRYTSNNLKLNNDIISVDNANDNSHLGSVFLTDQIKLIPDRLWLTLAGRLDKHTYVETEFQPSIRLSWKLNEQHRLWTAWSRASRIPSQLEIHADSFLGVAPPNTGLNPGPFSATLNLEAGENFSSEKVESIELGHRFSVGLWSVDSTVFYNDYDNLRSFDLVSYTLGPPSATHVTFDNDATAFTYGYETSVNWLPREHLKLQLNYAYFDGKFSVGQPLQTESPQHKASLTAYWDITNNLSISGTWGYTDKHLTFNQINTTNPVIDDFHHVDLGVNWAMSEQLSLSVFAKNLFYGNHKEFNSELFYSGFEIEPSVYGKLTLEF